MKDSIQSPPRNIIALNSIKVKQISKKQKKYIDFVKKKMYYFLRKAEKYIKNFIRSESATQIPTIKKNEIRTKMMKICISIVYFCTPKTKYLF